MLMLPGYTFLRRGNSLTCRYFSPNFTGVSTAFHAAGVAIATHYDGTSSRQNYKFAAETPFCKFSRLGIR